MKKFLFILSIVMMAGSYASAQSSKSCAKKCTKAEKAACAKMKADAETKVASAYMEADKIADADENIKKRVCSVSGSVSYFEKSQCATSGKVSWAEVKFDEDKKAFTRVASASMEKAKKKSCAAKCAAKKAKKTGV